MNTWIRNLKLELGKPLPGMDAWKLMAPSVRRSISRDRPLKKAGILILLYPHEESWYTVLIKRSEYEGVHSGQVSFPGGILEKTDCSLEDTALREAMEETGIDIRQVSILGNLTPLHIPASNTEVFPVVGVVMNRPAFKADPEEVQYIIEIKVADLLEPGNKKTRTMLVAGESIIVPYFDIGKDFIWGATAMILSEFLEIMKSMTGEE